MKRRFSLDGLLRVRRLQEDSAVAAHAAARTRANDAEARVRLARHVLGESAEALAASTDVLRAVAAARASSHAMLQTLGAEAGMRRTEADAASAAAVEARIRAAVVGKLAERHVRRLAVDEAAAEQRTLDEIAVIAALRKDRP